MPATAYSFSAASSAAALSVGSSFADVYHSQAYAAGCVKIAEQAQHEELGSSERLHLPRYQEGASSSRDVVDSTCNNYDEDATPNSEIDDDLLEANGDDVLVLNENALLESE